MKYSALFILFASLTSYAQPPPLQQMQQSIPHVDSASPFSRVAGMPNQQFHANPMNQPPDVMGQQGPDVCPNDLADPEVQRALNNLPKVFEQINQNPEVRKQFKHELNQLPIPRAAKHFILTANHVLRKHQITDVDPVQLCVDAEYRRKRIEQLKHRLDHTEYQSLLIADANLANEATNGDSIETVKKRLMQMVKEARGQITSKYPLAGKTIAKFETLYRKVIECRKTKNRLGRFAWGVAEVIGLIIYLPFGIVAFFGLGSAGFLASGLALIVFYILHLLFVLLTLISNQGVFAALTGASLRFLQAANLLTEGMLDKDPETRFFPNYAQYKFNEGQQRWAARNQGRDYYLNPTD